MPLQGPAAGHLPRQDGRWAWDESPDPSSGSLMCLLVLLQVLHFYRGASCHWSWVTWSLLFMTSPAPWTRSRSRNTWENHMHMYVFTCTCMWGGAHMHVCPCVARQRGMSCVFLYYSPPYFWSLSLKLTVSARSNGPCLLELGWQAPATIPGLLHRCWRSELNMLAQPAFSCPRNSFNKCIHVCSVLLQPNEKTQKHSEERKSVPKHGLYDLTFHACFGSQSGIELQLPWQQHTRINVRESESIMGPKAWEFSKYSFKMSDDTWHFLHRHSKSKQEKTDELSGGPSVEAPLSSHCACKSCLSHPGVSALPPPPWVQALQYHSTQRARCLLSGNAFCMSLGLILGFSAGKTLSMVCPAVRQIQESGKGKNYDM